MIRLIKIQLSWFNETAGAAGLRLRFCKENLAKRWCHLPSEDEFIVDWTLLKPNLSETCFPV